MRLGDSVSAQRLAISATILAGGVAVAVYVRRRSTRKSCRINCQPTVALRFSSPYASAVARDAIAQLGILEDPAAVCEVGDFAKLDWDAALREGEWRRVSALYIRAGLVRKGMLAHHLEKQRQRRLKQGQGSATGVPQLTFAAQDMTVLPPGLVVDLEDEDDLQSLQARLQREDRAILQAEVAGQSDAEPRWVAKAITQTEASTSSWQPLRRRSWSSCGRRCCKRVW
eukprot:TRINITY_DN84499_c0_g1_i1.p1 TRINITY_DN84499_c0_g1~~TRINITY_DN84499_c0_g1_i1.p1  ORF type:complete len:227 (-),score=30.47 TRINITY_DN84499_c0_g1_i1:389-1069(-)